jgi:hypothetical protein
MLSISRPRDLTGHCWALGLVTNHLLREGRKRELVPERSVVTDELRIG